MWAPRWTETTGVGLFGLAARHWWLDFSFVNGATVRVQDVPHVVHDFTKAWNAPRNGPTTAPDPQEHVRLFSHACRGVQLRIEGV